MKRRKFIRQTFIAGAATTLVPELTFAQTAIPYEELIGKGSPTFIENSGYILRPEAASAFDKMAQQAAKDGVPIQVVSSFRSYAHQNRIWERKYKAYTSQGLSAQQAIDKIIEYSTIPGTSRHHWGTDIDIVQSGTNVTGDLLVPNKFHGNGPFCKLKEWLDLHAEEYGFYLVYTNTYGRKGFNYEPWHFSYAKISKPFLTSYRKLNLKTILNEQQLMGSENFSDKFINRYMTENILDINPDLIA